jgi:hypothetical protein
MPARRSGIARAYGDRSPAVLRMKRYEELERRQLERGVRMGVGIATTMFISEAAQPIEIVNLSKRGFGASSAVSVLIGTQILVELPLTGVVRAEVRWGLGDRFGAIFAEQLELDPETIAAAAHSLV